MENIKDLIVTIGGISGLLALLLTSFYQVRRVKSQNVKDGADALTAAFEIAGIDAQKQLDLIREVGELRKELKAFESRQYRVSFTLTLSETPRVDDYRIEVIKPIAKVSPFFDSYT